MGDFSAMNLYEGLQFIPVTKEKKPIPKGWQTTQVKHDLSNAPAVGMVCGKLSGNVEMLDIDLKYDLTGNLYQHLKKVVNQYDANLLRKLVVQRTKNGGFHWIYRCKKVEGNKKLANRPTTPAERKDTYDRRLRKELDAGTPEPNAIIKARSEAVEDKVRVLIETRGEGGQFVCWPSEGYDIVYGRFQEIQEISEEERDILFMAAAEFNEIVEEYKPKTYNPPAPKTDNINGKSPFDDFNERGDVVQLLIDHGWKYVNTHGNKVHLQRAGDTKAKTSGNYDTQRRQFSVFTTSTVFEPQKAYLPYAVYTILEHSGDYQAARKSLYDKGFGDREEDKRDLNIKTPSRISPIVTTGEDDLPFIIKPEDVAAYVKSWKDGTFQKGKTTGFSNLDKHFLFKEVNLVMFNGMDNIGKTVLVLYLLVLAALYHNWKFVIYTAENSAGSVVRRLMEFYLATPLKLMNPVQEKAAREWVFNHFYIIRITEDVFNYRDIINMTKRVLLKENVRRNRTDYFSFLIDPSNALRIDIHPRSKLSVHDYQYEMLTETRMFMTQEGVGGFINNHVISEATRRLDAEGYPVPPQKADTEGGVKYANKADDFITLHRYIQHPTQWMWTELHVRKIKETETGGEPTPNILPVKLKLEYPNNCVFVETANGNDFSPVRRFHQMNEPQTDLPF